MIEKFNQGLTLHILDGNPEPISIENRTNAILRTPPNNETLQLVKRMVRSPRFEIRKAAIPASFLVVDGHQVIYESINFNSPEQFTIAIANYDDTYMGQQFIKYFQLLSRESKPIQFAESIKRVVNNILYLLSEIYKGNSPSRDTKGSYRNIMWR